MDTVSLKSMSNWPVSVIGRSLFLAHESMELCGLGSGDLCQIFVDDEDKGVFWAWPQTSPVNEDLKIEALMTWEAMCSLEINSGVEEQKVVSIKKFSDSTIPAQSVKLKSSDEKNKSFMSHPAFQAVTAMTCKNLILSENSSLVVNYYGRVVKLLAEKVVPCPDVDRLEHVVAQFEGINLNFSNLDDLQSDVTTSTPCKSSLSSKRSQSNKTYFLITERTRLQFEKSGFDSEDKSGEKTIFEAQQILDNIGGLDEEMEMIREATKTVLGPRPSRYNYLIC